MSVETPQPKPSPQPPIHVIAYTPHEVVEEHLGNPTVAAEFVGKYPVTWINIEGPVDPELVQEMGRLFDLHRLAIEDVVHGNQRAKVEPYGEYLFMALPMITRHSTLDIEQLSLFLGGNYVLTFQEVPGDSFDPVRNRIRKGGGRIRKAGPDYLAYALLDALVDSYYPVLEHYGERMEDLEDEILSRPEHRCIRHLHKSKRDLLTIRRAVWPQREMFGSLLRDPMPLISDETRIYLRDCYDHTVEIIDLVETLRELSSDLVDLYMTSVSNRLNEVMKVLTIIATIFMPLSFIAGVYGMNFNNDTSPWSMPELNWYWGYPFALGLMAAVGLALVWFFKRKGWLRSMDPSETKRNSLRKKR